MTSIKPLVLKNYILSLGTPILASVFIFSVLKAQNLFELLTQHHASLSSFSFYCLLSIFSTFSLILIYQNKDVLLSNDSEILNFTRTACNWLFGLSLLPGIFQTIQLPVDINTQPDFTLTVIMFVLSIVLGSFGRMLVQKHSNYVGLLLVFWTIFVPMAFLSEILQVARILILRC